MKRSPAPPQALRQPQVASLHGVQLRDDYAWMRLRDDPRVSEYLRRENDYADRVLKPLEPLMDELYREMVNRIQETDTSVPFRYGSYYYYSRTVAGLQYPIHCRKQGSLEAREEVLLDLNQLAVGRQYLAPGVLRVSPDHRLLAYSLDLSGAEHYTLFIKDLKRGTLLEERIHDTFDSMEWGADGTTLFYSRLNRSHRPFQLLRHRLGTPVDQDEVIHREEDEAFFVSISKTRSQRFLLLGLTSNNTSEVHFLDARDPGGEFQVISPRRHRVEYWVDQHGEFFYLTTNDEALNFRLVRTPIERPQREHWQEVIPHRPEIQLEEVLLFQDYMAVFERERGSTRLRVFGFAEEHFREVGFDEPIYSLRAGDNWEFDTHRIRVVYCSLTTPETVYDCHLGSGERELLKRTRVRGGFDPAHYQAERIFAQASDGIEIPVSLVYRRGLQSRDSRSPLLLYGYGAYGINVDPSFNSARLSLLDRGVTFAIAHVRGGADMGRHWYESGKLLNKKNTFQDFIACARELVNRGYTAPDRLGIMGGSAGGLLVGAVVNQCPELFCAAVAKVPFVDVVNSMLDSSLPLTVTEFEEWGDPRREEFFEYLLSYSPYDNVRPQPYPALLVIAGLNDPRVSFWEPAKWLAKLRQYNTGNEPLLLRTNLEAGHSGRSGRYEKLRETALIFGFLLDRFRLVQPESPA